MNENPTNVDEQFKLGLCYLNGDGVPQDMKKAAYWNLKAAEQGHAKAQSGIGDVYREMGDIDKAMYWWSKAAEQGDASGQYNLGVSYEMGWGVSKDREKAVNWWKKAAAQGHEDAKFNLETLRRQGLL